MKIFKMGQHPFGRVQKKLYMDFLVRKLQNIGKEQKISGAKQEIRVPLESHPSGIDYTMNY
jgi:hypothetical protein